MILAAAGGRAVRAGNFHPKSDRPGYKFGGQYWQCTPEPGYSRGLSWRGSTVLSPRRWPCRAGREYRRDRPANCSYTPMSREPLLSAAQNGFLSGLPARLRRAVAPPDDTASVQLTIRAWRSASRSPIAAVSVRHLTEAKNPTRPRAWPGRWGHIPAAGWYIGRGCGCGW